MMIFLFFAEISKASDLLCSDWLDGTIDPTNSNRSIDSKGIKGVCRDFFPTWGEREKIERTTTDPFEARYTVTRQYCWARFFLDGSNKCGAPSINGWALFIPISFTWDPPAYTLWGDTKVASVPLEATIRCSSDDDITIIALLNKARICRFNPGETFLHGGTNTENQIQVCGYYVQWLFSGIIGRGDWSDNLIGCINAPLLPGPPTFNAIITAGSAPYVDTALKAPDLIALGSTFDQPLIQLKSVSSAGSSGSSTTNTVLLKHKFDGDTSYSMPDGMDYDKQQPQIPQCSIFPNVPAIKYCAKVPTNNPGVVCACESTECDNGVFLGCVPRPTPKQSNVAIVAAYSPDSDQMGNMYPAAEVIFAKTRADGSVIQIDEGGNGSEVYFDAQAGGFKKLDVQGNKTQTVAIQPIVYVRLPLSDPNNKLLVREYYTQQMADPQDSTKVTQVLARGTGSLYGLQFMSIIPKFNTDGSIRKIRVYTAQARQSDDGCCAFTTMPQDSSFPQYIVPGGTRDTSACCPSSIPVADQMTKCAVPPYSPTCKNGSAAPVRDILAEEAICSGGYTGPAHDNGSQICLLNQTNWTDAAPAPICGALPLGCDAVTVPSPSSGYTIWPQANQNEVQTGSCDIGYGLVANIDVKIVPADFSSLSPTDMVAAQSEYNALLATLATLKTQAAAENRNIQDSELPALQYNQITKTVIQPIRTCSGSVFNTIKNPCVYAPQCIATTKQSPINGAALWPDSSILYQPNAAQNILGDNGTGQIYQDTETVSSSCTAPYATSALSGAPTRQCVTRYKINNGAVQLLNQFWGAWQNACQQTPAH